jgi:hypothetical protein
LWPASPSRLFVVVVATTIIYCVNLHNDHERSTELPELTPVRQTSGPGYRWPGILGAWQG